LCLAAAAAIINLWLSMRIGNLRAKGKILYGDGGDEMLMRRMRAQANFIENTPLVLILVAAIEVAGSKAGSGGTWLAVVGAIYMLARLGHAIGMDGGSMQPARSVGALVTMLTQLGLAVVAVLIALGRF
jgi:uncharacterized membrane protein YecN with MAPEG domain